MLSFIQRTTPSHTVLVRISIMHDVKRCGGEGEGGEGVCVGGGAGGSEYLAAKPLGHIDKSEEHTVVRHLHISLHTETCT